MSTISAISDAAASARGSVKPAQCDCTRDGRRDDVERTAAMQRHRRLGQQLEASAERALRAPHALADRVDLARAAREEREDLVRFAEIAGAQHDRVGRVRAFDQAIPRAASSAAAIERRGQQLAQRRVAPAAVGPRVRQRHVGAPNSASTWRHAPHGGVVTPSGPLTATAAMRRAPASTAANTAVRSAQIVSPYDAFSTFAPVKRRPSAVSHRRADGEAANSGA